MKFDVLLGNNTNQDPFEDTLCIICKIQMNAVTQFGEKYTSKL